MKYKLDCSYLDDISKAVIDLDNAALTTYILTNIALKRAYDRIELSKEQIELFEADVKAAKLNGLWDFVEEEKTIENYISNIEIQKQLKKLSKSEQLKFHIERLKEANNVMDLNLSETEIIEKANRTLNKN